MRADAGGDFQGGKGVSLERLEEALNHLEAARFYLGEALKFMELGDPFNAAEKVWAAVKRATLALTLALLGEVAPRKGESWREFVKRAFAEAGFGEKAEELAAYFIDVRSKLHGDCFYGLDYEEKEHKPLIDRAPEYVELVEELVKLGVRERGAL